MNKSCDALRPELEPHKLESPIHEPASVHEPCLSHEPALPPVLTVGRFMQLHDVPLLESSLESLAPRQNPRTALHAIRCARTNALAHLLSFMSTRTCLVLSFTYKLLSRARTKIRSMNDEHARVIEMIKSRPRPIHYDVGYDLVERRFSFRAPSGKVTHEHPSGKLSICMTSFPHTIVMVMRCNPSWTL